MKKYVIIVRDIGNMGGGQMYVRNKMVWLKKNGWKVDLIYCTAKNVILSEFRNVGKEILDFVFSYYFTPKYRREHIINEAFEFLYEEEVEEYIIETTSLSCSTWGEVLAKRLGAKHFVYLIDESNIPDTDKCFDFLYFKHERKELASITKTSLQQMFERHTPISIEESYCLQAHCSNVVEDYNSSFCEVVKEQRVDYIIGCVGRLEKPYVLPMLHQLKEYITSHYNKQFLLLMIGGAPIGNTINKEIYKIFDHIRNVRLILTGYMFPISRKLINLCDVFISSSGSAWVAMKEGVPTISIDGNDYFPIGILGRTTNNSLFRNDEEPALSLSDLLDDILLSGVYQRNPLIVDPEVEFNSHLDFINSSEKKILYYDINTIKPIINEKILLKLGLLVFGAKGYYKLYELKFKIKAKLQLYPWL